jgi:hypothetical protein
MDSQLPVREPDAAPTELIGAANEERRRPGGDGRVLPALILIALGVAFLIGNLGFVQFGGAMLFLGLSAAFLAARLLTGNYGFAVPAGVLAGFGAYVALDEVGALPGNNGGWFFILLGLGFVAVYLFGLRPAAVWPFFPAAALIAFGALTEGFVSAWPLASLAWLASYWPLVLVAVGVWLLLRDRLPPAIRQPLAALGAAALIIYGVIAVAGTFAATAGPFDGPMPNVNVGIGLPGLGGPVTTETQMLQAPVAAGEVVRISNPNGRTVVRAGSGGEARVTATKRYTAGQQPEARLTPGANGLLLEALPARSRSFFLGRSVVDFVVELPAATPLTIEAASGDIDASGLLGAVQVNTASGDVTLSSLSGPVTVQTISGDQRLTDLTGETRINTTSGEVRASGLVHLREATSVSGDLRLSGIVTESGTVKTTSGEVTARFVPTSAVRVEVTTVSGDIRVQGLTLGDQQRGRRSLTGVLGAGAGVLRIETTSGDVTLAAA